MTAQTVKDVQFDILDVTVASLQTHSRDARTGYLEALVSADVVGIATLNFDTLVEWAAEACGAAVVTGADDWDGSYTWPIPGMQPCC